VTPSWQTGDPWTDGLNMLVLGKTQTGKTSLCRELHDTSPRLSVWLNATGADRVEDVPGRTVRSLSALQDALRDDCWAIEWVSDDRRRDYPRLQRLQFELADATDRSLRQQTIVDEAHELAPTGRQSQDSQLYDSQQTARRFAKRGVKRGIKHVAVTQDPTAMDSQTMRQSEHRVVFDMTSENRKSSVLKRMGFDWDAVDAGDRFTGVLFDDSGQIEERAVKAQEEYA